MPYDDGSITLITVVQAAHWLNLPRFFTESRRVLHQNGVVALIVYPLPQVRVPGAEASVNNAISEAIAKVHTKRNYVKEELVYCSLTTISTRATFGHRNACSCAMNTKISSCRLTMYRRSVAFIAPLCTFKDFAFHSSLAFVVLS